MALFRLPKNKVSSAEPVGTRSPVIAARVINVHECASLTYWAGIHIFIDDEVFLYARSQACRRQLRFGARLTAHVIARMKAEGGHSLALESIC